MACSGARIRRRSSILGLAENQADARLVVGVPKQVVNGGEIEVHLAGVFRFERPSLQIDDAEAAQLEVVEEQIELEVFAPDFERILATDEGEAGAQFQQELRRCVEQAAFDSRSWASAESVRKSKL